MIVKSKPIKTESKSLYDRIQICLGYKEDFESSFESYSSSDVSTCDLDFDKSDQEIEIESKNFLDKFVIPHDNILIIIWNMIMILLKVYSGLISLVLASFRNETMDLVETQE